VSEDRSPGLDCLGCVEQQILAETSANQRHALRHAAVTADGHRARRQAEDVDRHHHAHCLGATRDLRDILVDPPCRLAAHQRQDDGVLLQ
jgi:hypothetical protein